MTFKLKAISQEEKKTVTFSYRGSKAVQRTYAPQGLFGLLAADLKREDYFIEVDLDDPFFRTFAVTAEVPFDMAKIGLRSINVSLDYGDPADPENHKHGDLIFDASTAQTQTWEVHVNNALDLGYTPRIEYNFDPQSDWQGEQTSYTVEPGWTQDRSLTLNPYAQLGFTSVQVLPSGLDAATFSSVDVELTYSAPSGWQATRTLTVTADSEPQYWRVRTPEPEGSSVSYRLTYHLVTGGSIVQEPVTTKAGSVAVDNPFARYLQPEFRFTFPPGQFEKVQIDVDVRRARARLPAHPAAGGRRHPAGGPRRADRRPDRDGDAAGVLVPRRPGRRRWCPRQRSRDHDERRAGQSHGDRGADGVRPAPAFRIPRPAPTGGEWGAALDRVRSALPAEVTVARASLGDVLRGTSGSALGSAAWSVCGLTPTGYPVELGVTSAAAEVRWVAAVLAPEDDPGHALDVALGLAGRRGAGPTRTALRRPRRPAGPRAAAVRCLGRAVGTAAAGTAGRCTSSCPANGGGTTCPTVSAWPPTPSPAWPPRVSSAYRSEHRVPSRPTPGSARAPSTPSRCSPGGAAGGAARPSPTDWPSSPAPAGSSLLIIWR